MANVMSYKIFEKTNTCKCGVSIYDDQQLCEHCESIAKELARVKNISQHLKDYGVPVRYRNCSFDNIECATPRQRNIINHYRDNVPHDFLVLLGKSGTCKTHIAVSVLREVAIKLKCSIMFYGVNKLLSDIKIGFDTDGKIQRCVNNVKYLVLDDLGAQNITEWSNSVIYEIINNRYESELTTIITTNLSKQSILSKFGARLYSRLHCGTFINFADKDYRVQNRGKKIAGNKK